MEDKFAALVGYIIFMGIMIILITDLQNFSAVSENLSAENIEFLRLLLAGIFVAGTGKFVMEMMNS